MLLDDLRRAPRRRAARRRAARAPRRDGHRVDDDGDALFCDRSARSSAGRPDRRNARPARQHLAAHGRRGRLLVGYDTYPHVDMGERGHEAAAILPADSPARSIRTPRCANRRCCRPRRRMPTDRMPMRELLRPRPRLGRRSARAQRHHRRRFPPADVARRRLHHPRHHRPRRRAGRSDRRAISPTKPGNRREGFLGGVTSFADAAERLRALDRDELPGSGPLVLVDIGDNPWTGGPGDSAELVRFLLARRRERRRRRARCAIRHRSPPRIAAGPGATIDVALGGKTDRLHGEPLPVRAEVRLLSDGTLRQCRSDDGRRRGRSRPERASSADRPTIDGLASRCW